MSEIRLISRSHMAAAAFLTVAVGAHASVLSLSSTPALADTPVTLSLTLDSESGTEPSAVQWILTFPPGPATVESAVAGPAAESAGKSLMCASQTAGSYSCILYSLGTSAIPNGVVAQLTVRTSSTAAFNVEQTAGASPDAASVAVYGSGGIVSVSTPSTTGAFTAIRVNAGGADYTGVNGVLWSADYGYSGGTTSGVSAPISQALNPTLYQTERWDPEMVQYRFAVPAGRYEVTLGFAEIYFNQPGQRVFNAAINGSTVLTNFDIVSEAGGPLVAIQKSFTVDATDSILIQLTPVVQYPKISAIKILQAP
jgi:hypothetical protein